MDAEGKLRHSSSLGAQPGCLKTSRASAPVWGWNLTVTFPSSEPGTFAGHHGAILDPKAAETLKKPQAGAASPSSSATAPHSKGSPGISPRLSLPQKMPFPPGMHRPGGGGLQAPLPPAAAAAVPQHQPPLLAASPSCSHAPDFLPGGPRPPTGFSHGSRSTRRSLRPCERQTGCRGSAGVGRQPTAAQGSCAPPPSKCSSHFFTPRFPAPLFLSQQGGHGEEKSAGWGNPQLP